MEDTKAHVFSWEEDLETETKQFLDAAAKTDGIKISRDPYLFKGGSKEKPKVYAKYFLTPTKLESIDALQENLAAANFKIDWVSMDARETIVQCTRMLYEIKMQIRDAPAKKETPAPKKTGEATPSSVLHFGMAIHLDEPLSKAVERELLDEFDGSNWYKGGWWGAKKKKEELPSSNMLEDKNGNTYVTAWDFNDARTFTFIWFSKDRKTIRVDKEHNFSDIQDVLDDNGVKYRSDLGKTYFLL